MTKASDDALGALHGAVAEALTDVIQNGVVVSVKDDQEVRVTAPAAYIGAAIAFLKNNNITADPSTNEGLNNLEKQLRQRKARLTPQALQEAADEFAAQQGGGMLN